jgi:anti-sigma factor RsiW
VDQAMSHAEYEQLAAGYVLGALEPDDEHRFQRHLEGCTVCEASVRELEEVAGALAYAAPPVEPPAALRASIRQEIGATARPRRVRPFKSRTDRALSRTDRAQSGAEQALSRADRGQSRADRAQSRTNRALPRTTRGQSRATWGQSRADLALPRMNRALLTGLAVAACILALFALGFWNMSLRNENMLYRQRVAAFEEAGRLLQDPTTQTVRLTGPGTGRGARVTVFASSRQDRGALIVEGLGAPPAGRVYELWGIPNGKGLDQAMPATVFRTGGEGVAPFLFELPIQPSMTYGVTEEPGPGGSRKPTRPPILVGSSTTRA